MRRLLALLIGLGSAGLLWATLPQYTLINAVLTPSHTVNTKYLDGNDGTAAIPLTWATIPSQIFTSGTSASVNLRSAYLTEPGSPLSTLSVISCTLPTGVSAATDGLSYSGSGTGSAACQMRATRNGVTADSNLFSVTVNAGGTDTLAPTIPENVTATATPGANVILWDASADMHDGTNPGSGIDHYEVLLGGSHLANVSAPAGISVPFTQTILGTFSPTATSSQSGTSFTLTSAGTGFHNTTTEQGIFRGGQVTGDFSISARIAAFSSDYVYSTGGLMVYETVAQGSRFYFNYQEPTNGSHGPQTKSRVTAGVNSSNVASVPGVNPPTCLKTTRVGNVFTSYYSSVSNCSSWTQYASQTIAMAATAYVGLAMSSQNAGDAQSITFDQVDLTQSSAPTYTHATSSQGTYTVKAYDVAGNVSAASASVTQTPLPVANLIKWHPGIYPLNSTTDAYSTTLLSQTVTAGSSVAGVTYWASWRALEPTRGNYDFSSVSSAIATSKASGKRTILQIQDRTFGGTTALPDYLATENNGVDSSGCKYQKTAGGSVQKFWLANCYLRYKALVQALSNTFDTEPYLEGVHIFSETDAGISTSEWTAADFSATGYQSQILAFIDDLTTANTMWQHTLKWIGLNFDQNGQSGVETVANYIYARTQYGIGVMPPDLIPGSPSYAGRVYHGQHWNGTSWVTTGGTNWTGLALYHAQVQGPEMGGKAGNFKPTDFYTEATTTFDFSHMVVFNKNFTWSNNPANSQTYWSLVVSGEDSSWRWVDYLDAAARNMNANPPTPLVGKVNTN